MPARSPSRKTSRRWIRHPRRPALAAIAAIVVIAGCSRFPEPRVSMGPTGEGPGTGIEALPGESAQSSQTQPAETVTDDAPTEFYAPGSDRFTATPTVAAALASSEEGDVTLNFENTSLLEVVKVILSDLLGESYAVAPGVTGSVTLQSSRPVSRDALIPTLEMLLRMNGAALVRRAGGYQVVPRDQALRGGVSAQLGDTGAPLPAGYSVRVVPLEFVAAAEMRSILEPYTDPGSVLRVDSARNMLVLAGSSEELGRLLETIDVFDVDWMAGMSVAMFTPDFVDAKTLASELEQALGTGEEGPASGLIRFVPIERLNGLLVVTPRKAYLARVRQWVERLDRAGAGVGRRLFVYHVQNGKAVDLAEVLGQVFEGGRAEAPAAEVAPGLEAARVGGESTAPADAGTVSQPRGEAAGDVGTGGAAAGEGTAAERSARAPGPSALERADRIPLTGEGVEVSESSDIRIIADEINNALLILATPMEYKQVEAALRQLDIAPLQVLIEATIAEVQLTDELSQGLEWFLKNNFGSKRGTATFDANDTAGLAALVPGFSYTITDSAAIVRAVLNTLASQSKARVVSSPSLMVLNNQQATIQVGDEVPVTTQQQQSTSTTANIINSIEYRETGVTLSVTPRVNAGGLVTMEVEQEVSDVAANAASPLTPTIQQRTINSTIAVQSGETVVLGGLIRERDNRTDSGVPGVREVPVLGWFFGSSTDSLQRTELVVLITPRAIRGEVQAREVTREFRDKMDSLKPSDLPPRGFGPWYHRLDRLEKFLEDGQVSAPPATQLAMPRPPAVQQLRTTQEQEHALKIERVLDPGRPSRPKPRPEPDFVAPVALSLDPRRS